jgi:hypothetical protein
MDDLTRTIEKTVASAIESQAKAQFLTALGGTDQLIDRFLHVASKYTVKRDYRDVPLLDATIQDTVQKVVKDLVAEMVDENRDELKKAIASRLRSNAKDVATQLVDSCLGEGKNLYIFVSSRSE